MTNINTCETCQSPLSRSSEGWHCLSCAQTEHTQHTGTNIVITTSSKHDSPIHQINPPKNPVTSFVTPTIAADVAVASQPTSYKRFTNADMVVKQRNKIRQHNRKRALSAAYTIGGVLLVSSILTLASTPSKAPPSGPRTNSTASLVSPAQKVVDQAAIKRDEQRKADLSEIATALHVYQKTNGNYPVGTDISVLYFMQYSNPSYISRINYDPLGSSGGKAIKYNYRSDGTHFNLSAQLESTTDPQAQSGIYQLTD